MIPITQKSQIIDDDAEFKIKQLEQIAQDKLSNPKKYQILSIIGSQSSGKSTLLNSIFSTSFEQQNRSQRLGQTTKGIWMSIDKPNNIIILDVQGSDSNERQERTRVQRRNSLFSFAVSHTLLINIGIQQIGTYKGAQLQILQIILELNLRLFGVEKPKQIIFVVRDYIKRKQSQNYLKQKLQGKVQLAWQKISKPQDKKQVKLKDIFNLNVFFLPNKLQPRQQQNWEIAVGHLRKFLIQSTQNTDLIKDNIAVNDLPQYLSNVWKTIQSDKDINLPQQKILLSNMRCQQIKLQIQQKYAKGMRDQIQRSQRELDLTFKQKIGTIVSNLLKQYDALTKQYIQTQSQKIKDDLKNQINDKIFLSFNKQAKDLQLRYLKIYEQQADKQFSQCKQMKKISNLQSKNIAQFKNDLTKISYIQSWMQQIVNNYQRQVLRKYQNFKQKIINDSIKQFNRLTKKQLQNIVSDCFLDKQKIKSKFWASIRGSLQKLGFKSRNSIKNLYDEMNLNINLQQKNRRINKLIDNAQQQVKNQLKSLLKLKCIDLSTFIMKHFINQFSMDATVPRIWTNYKEQQINQLYEELRKTYISLVSQFTHIQIQQKKQKPVSMSMILPQIQNDDIILDAKQEGIVLKKIQQQMKKQYQQAIRKSKQTQSVSIPTWAYALLGIVAIDDVILWFTSPMLAIPLLLILIIFLGAFLKGGKGLIDNIIGMAKQKVTGAVSSATFSAISSKKSQ